MRIGLSKLIKLYISYGGISLYVNYTPIKPNFLRRGKDCELNQNQGNLRQVIRKAPRTGTELGVRGKSCFWPWLLRGVIPLGS